MHKTRLSIFVYIVLYPSPPKIVWPYNFSNSFRLFVSLAIHLIVLKIYIYKAMDIYVL